MKKIPIFREVAQKIRERVLDGTYVSSQRLPSEYELAKEFDVSRLTVRKAIDELIAQNILVKQKGRGTYAMQSQKIQSGRSGLQGFSEAAKAYGKESRTVLIQFEETPFEEQLWETLQADSRETIYHIVRLRGFDEEPMTVENLHVRAKYLPFESEKQLTDSIFQLIEKKIEIAYSHQEVEAVLVDTEMSRLLQVPVGNPLLLVHSITYSVTGVPILYDTSYYRADKYTFKNTLHRRI